MKVTLTERDALVVVDLQNDFLPGGALPVPEGDTIIPVVNSYVELFLSKGLPIFATRDWHPDNHVSFRENGGPWPKHCVKETEGAAFPSSLNLPSEAFVINKGDRPELEAYSGFQGTLLDSLLKERGVKRVFVCGLATDYCVKHTVLGALNLGYFAFFLEDASKGVDLKEGDSEKAVKEMLLKGAVAITLKEIK